MRYALISCVKDKHRGRHRAVDLYKSTYFRFSLRYTTRHYDVVFILSAKHGLLSLDDVINWYDLSMDDLSAKERVEWADKVAQQIREIVPPGSVLHFFCGVKYRQYLVDELSEMAVSVPLEGLEIGYQLQWYKRFTQ